jgi:hypothetical protein
LHAKIEAEKIAKKSPNTLNKNNDRISPGGSQLNNCLTIKVGTEQKWDINNINTSDPNITLPVLRPKAVRLTNVANSYILKNKDKKVRSINIKDEKKLSNLIEKNMSLDKIKTEK